MNPQKVRDKCTYNCQKNAKRTWKLSTTSRYSLSSIQCIEM